MCLFGLLLLEFINWYKMVNLDPQICISGCLIPT